MRSEVLGSEADAFMAAYGVARHGNASTSSAHGFEGKNILEFVGDLDQRPALGEALALVEETDERYWETELHRVQGELLLMQGDEAEAEASFHKAIEVARRQNAKSWELRATTSLARLWQQHGRADEARQALAEIYDWFTEGFETADLQEAKALLKELSNS